MRELRSSREIKLMRAAGLMVWRAHHLAESLLAPGVTTGEVDAAVERFFHENNVIPLFKNFPNSSPGRPAFPSVTCISINEEVVHGIPGKRRLVEGDLVSIDIGCKVNNWCGDAAVTHLIGKADPQVKRLVDVTRGVLDLAIEQMGRRSYWREVAGEMQTYVRDNGFSVVEDFVGHGIGKEMHEDPQVPNFVSRQLRRGIGDFPLERGLVIAVEPMVNLGTRRVKPLADHWTVSTADEKPSAHFEHTIAILESGPVALTEAPSTEEEEQLGLR